MHPRFLLVTFINPMPQGCSFICTPTSALSPSGRDPFRDSIHPTINVQHYLEFFTYVTISSFWFKSFLALHLSLGVYLKNNKIIIIIIKLKKIKKINFYVYIYVKVA